MRRVILMYFYVLRFLRSGDTQTLFARYGFMRFS